MLKWVEMNNARVIPIPYDTPKGALDMILNQVKWCTIYRRTSRSWYD